MSGVRPDEAHVQDLIAEVPEDLTLAELEKFGFPSDEERKKLYELEQIERKATASLMRPGAKRIKMSAAQEKEIEEMRGKIRKYAVIRAFHYPIQQLVKESAANFSQAAVLAHRLGRAEESQEFLGQAHLVAQAGGMKVKDIMSGELAAPENASYDSESVLEIARALKETGKLEESARFVLESQASSRDKLTFLGEVLPQLVKENPQNEKILDLVKQFLGFISHRSLPKYIQEYESGFDEPSLKIALLLETAFNLKPPTKT